MSYFTWGPERRGSKGRILLGGLSAEAHKVVFYVGAGAQAGHAAVGSVGVAEWIMPDGGTVGEATATAEGVVAVGINDGVGCCRGWCGSEGGLAEAAVVGNGGRKW